MDIDWQYKLIALLILFIISAFFSGSEVALFSLDKKRIKKQFEDNHLVLKYLQNMLEAPRRLLVTILLGNTIVNVAASIIAVSIALDYASVTDTSPDLVLTIQIVVLTVLVIIFGELIPKVWAAKNPVSFAKIIIIPLHWIGIIIYPVTEILTEIIRSFAKNIKYDKARSVISPDELPDLADLGHEKGTIEEEEHGLIHSIVSFKSVTVREVMTPRVDIISLSINSDFNDILKIVTESGYSRIPLFKENLDEIVGVLYSKDLLPYIKDPPRREQLSLEKIARRALFVPETKLISDLLREFQSRKMHIAIVVDEYGGTAGLVSLEDVIEEIIGEIHDEYDKEETPVSKIDNNSYIVLGKFPIDELKELIDITLEEEDEFETVGGLILNKAGHIPPEGYSFEIDNYRFTVKEILGKRIKKVQIELLGEKKINP